MSFTVSAFPAEAFGVDVVLAPVAASLTDPTMDEGFMQMAPGEFLAVLDGVGRVHVTRDRVTVGLEPGQSVEQLDYVMYGWVPRWIRILREEYALHASAVRFANHAIAVMGFSGAGKSTTVTALTQLGYDLIIDDVVPVDFESGKPYTSGWSRPVHLTDEAAEQLGITSTTRIGPRQNRKLATNMPSVTGRWPLATAIELSPDPKARTVSVTPLSGAAKFQAVLNHSNTSGASAGNGRSATFFDWATRLTNSIDVFRITRPTQDWSLPGVIDAVRAVLDQGKEQE